MKLFKYIMLSILSGSVLASLALSASAEVRLWITDARTDGHMGPKDDPGGLEGAAGMCMTDKNRPGIAGQVHVPFVAFSAHQDLNHLWHKHMIPLEDTVTNQDGKTEIAWTHADLLLAYKKHLLNPVTSSHHNIKVWTGANQYGEALTDANCSGFTSSDENEYGVKGTAHAKDETYISADELTSEMKCNTLAPIYCLSFTPHR